MPDDGWGRLDDGWGRLEEEEEEEPAIGSVPMASVGGPLAGDGWSRLEEEEEPAIGWLVIDVMKSCAD